MVANLTHARQPRRAVTTESGEEDVLLAVLSRKLKTKDVKEVEPFKFSRDGRTHPIPFSSPDEGR